MSTTATTNTGITNLINATTKLLDEVVSQKSTLKGAAQIASQGASDAAKFAQVATNAAANAVQISGIDKVDDVITARAGELSNAPVEAISGSSIKIVADANGNYNTMFSIPCYTLDDVGMSDLMGTGVHPAFLRADGTIKPEMLIGAFTASNKNGKPHVIAGSSPWTAINFDNAKLACETMGAGWHMMTSLEWSAVALWCLACNCQPSGNSEFGRDFNKKFEFCKRRDGKLPNDRVVSDAAGLCGTGPDQWRHNASPVGISDLVGNVNEWVDGVKMLNGVLIVATKNNQIEGSWLNTGAKFEAGTGPKWSTINTTASNDFLKTSLIEPITETRSLSGQIYFNANDERMASRGGSWTSLAGAGLAALNFNETRAGFSSVIGFRPVYSI